ncbi:hypothetical protein NQZ79_g1638 [Umbelopsis isabellina]|nr:hypothetical protein NQZ79_g1638 [Umbelopsis isabellina]
MDPTIEHEAQYNIAQSAEGESINKLASQTADANQPVVAFNDSMPDSQQPRIGEQNDSAVTMNGHITSSLEPVKGQEHEIIASTNDQIPDSEQQMEVQQQVEEHSQPFASTNVQIPQSLQSLAEQDAQSAVTLEEQIENAQQSLIAQSNQSVTHPANQVTDYQQSSTATPMQLDSSQSAAPAAAPITKEQWKWCNNTLKALRKHKSSGPFLEPVDIVKFNIPDYPNIVKHPMDLGTVQAKVNSQQYCTIDEFVADVRLIFSNCYLFNGHDSPVSTMATEVEKAFDRAVYKMPPAVQMPAPVPAASAPSQAPAKPLIRKESKTKEKKATAVVEGDLSPEEQKRCRKALDEMKKPQYNNIAWPFLLPVDPVAWGIVGYFDVVKKPMDISTVEKKLNANEYANVTDFEQDVRQIFINCYLFNTPDNEVYQMGKSLEAVFDAKWNKAPKEKEKKVMSAKEKRIEQLEAQLRLLKEQLNHQQAIEEDDENDEDFEETEVEPAPAPKRARMGSRRRLDQLEDDESDDDEYAPKKPKTSKSFPALKTTSNAPALSLSPPPVQKPSLPSSNGPALSKSPPSFNPLAANRPKLALGASITTLSPPSEKDQEKKPEIVLQNEDKWLALMQSGGTQPSQSSQTSTTTAPTSYPMDAISPGSNTSPAQDSQKVDPLWQKFQEDRRVREEQEREARELLERKERERKEEERRLFEQAEAAKRAKEEAEREKRVNYRRQREENAVRGAKSRIMQLPLESKLIFNTLSLQKTWNVDLYRQKRLMEQFERESWADSEWRDEMKRQQEAAESRRVIMPAFTLHTGLTLEQVKNSLFHHRDHYEQRKQEHGDERVLDMEME